MKEVHEQAELLLKYLTKEETLILLGLIQHGLNNLEAKDADKLRTYTAIAALEILSKREEMNHKLNSTFFGIEA